MEKYYIIQDVDRIKYLRPMMGGYTGDLKAAGKWPTEESAATWISNMEGNFIILPLYIGKKSALVNKEKKPDIRYPYTDLLSGMGFYISLEGSNDYFGMWRKDGKAYGDMFPNGENGQQHAEAQAKKLIEKALAYSHLVITNSF